MKWFWKINENKLWNFIIFDKTCRFLQNFQIKNHFHMLIFPRAKVMKSKCCLFTFLQLANFYLWLNLVVPTFNFYSLLLFSLLYFFTSSNDKRRCENKWTRRRRSVILSVIHFIYLFINVDDYNLKTSCLLFIDFFCYFKRNLYVYVHILFDGNCLSFKLHN